MFTMFSQSTTRVCGFAVLFLLSVVEGQTSRTNISMTSTDDVIITADPETMQTGFTKHLSVNCTFSRIHDSSFYKLTSLILTKKDNYQEDDYEVATIAAHSPSKVQNVHSMGSDVKGEINVDDVSYISFQWRYPSSQVQGMYKCAAYGLDRNGHPMHSSAVMEVIEQEADFSMYLDKMKTMDSELDQCMASKSAMVKMLQAQTSQFNERLQELTSQFDETLREAKTHIKSLQTRLDTSRSSNAVNTRSWNGHNYYISGLERQNSRVLQSKCRLYGGYLAEINDGAEYHFLFQWLHEELKIEDLVALGATDEGNDGQWTWMSSGKPMDYINWSKIKEVGYGEDCLFVSKEWGGLLDDYCVHQDHLVRFLCEVES